MIKKYFFELLSKYNLSNDKIEDLWLEIEQNYTSKNRYYHTLAHLEHILNQLIDVQKEVKDWDTILFSMYYHDIIYDAKANDNEEKSAKIAALRMSEIEVPKHQIETCVAQILATKRHLKTENNDTNLFIDADLSILGQSSDLYIEYYKNVRKEYKMYPDFLYNLGRKKVLKHFLTMENIFKTPHFNFHFEAYAKLNIQKEIDIL